MYPKRNIFQHKMNTKVKTRSGYLLRPDLEMNVHILNQADNL